MMNGENIFQFHHVSVASPIMVTTWTANDQVYTTESVVESVEQIGLK